MLFVRNIKYFGQFKNKLISNTFLRYSVTHDLQPAIQDTGDKYDKQLKMFETITNVTKKIRMKKPNRPPFAKNLFLGIFDNEILTYPQLEKEDADLLEKEIYNLKKVLQQSHMLNFKSISDKSFRQNLYDYKVIGLQASQLLDARGCNVSESLRFLETLCEHNLGQSLVSHEQLAVQLLVTFAGDNIKRKYLHSIIKGETLAALCLNEEDCVDVTSFKTNAKLTSDQKQWILNGEKNWVFNGGMADHLIVFAKSKTTHIKGVSNVKLSAFLIDRDSPGISIQNYDTSGINVADISFQDTPVSVENVIGELHHGESMIKPILNQYRLAIGPMCITLGKKIVNNLAKDILKQSNDKNLLHKTDAIIGRIAEMMIQLYAMESMVYLTTGLQDSYENQDVELESALVKIFCCEKLQEISLGCLDLIGTPAASNGHWANETHKQAISYLTLNESNELSKIIIALLGLQHAGVAMNELVQKLRNPFYFANFHFKRILTSRRDVGDNPKLDFFLHEHLHPALMQPSKSLEYSVKRLRYVTECILARHGAEIVGQHMELRRLANVIVDIYGIVAVLGRSSRAYCIGLQNSDLERLMAICYTTDAIQRVRMNVTNMLQQYEKNDGIYRTLANKMFKFKEYYVKHPLTRNI